MATETKSEPMNREVYRGFVIEVHWDDDPEDPREWDNVGTMLCWHREYLLGDEKGESHQRTPDAFQEWLVERRRDRKERDPGVIILPLYLYDHSGLAISTGRMGQFSDPWDSMQVGWIYVTHEEIRRRFGVKQVKRQARELARRCLIQEVLTYNDYLTRQVFGYIVSDGESDHLDSCWGMYDGEGQYNGAYALAQARETVDTLVASGRVPVPVPDEDEDEDGGA